MRFATLVVLLAIAGCSRLNPIAPECPGCRGHACVPDAGTCNSGFCVDGVCCDSACNGTCDRCDLAGSEGTCTVAPLGTEAAPSCSPYACDGVAVSCPASCNRDELCASGFYCDGNVCKRATCAGDTDCDVTNYCDNGRCRPPQINGGACTRALQCQSGFCVDGVCCGTACTGACEACNNVGALGTCGAAPSRSPGRPACGAFVCDGAARACPTSCTGKIDCATGFACSSSTSPSTCLADGDGDGVASVDDCAPADAMKSVLRNCFLDSDNDGVFSPTATPTCSGAACPAGTRSDAGTDCDDTDAGGYQLITCSFGPDSDNDGYHAGAGVSTCTTTGCPDGGSSLRDCDDFNANAHPGQRNFFSTPRDGGSYDYDCDGTEERDPFWTCASGYSTTAGCQAIQYTGQRGFVGGAPACGDAGVWRTCASWENASCNSGMWWYGGCGTGCVFVDGGTSFSVEDTQRWMDCR
jgi:hypothetical protein